MHTIPNGIHSDLISCIKDLCKLFQIHSHKLVLVLIDFTNVHCALSP